MHWAFHEWLHSIALGGSTPLHPAAIVTGILLGRYILGSMGEGDLDSGLGKIIRSPAISLWKSKLTHYRKVGKIDIQ
jgi:hypothetical protein